MLETLREYAAEKLEESGEASALRAAHLAWFLRLAEESQERLLGPEQAEWLARLETEHENLRAALDAADDPALRLRLSCALCRFWAFRGYWREGRGRLERAIAAGDDRDADRLRATALYWIGRFAEFQGDYAGAAEPAEQSLVVWRALGDREGLMRSLHLAAALLLQQGRIEESVSLARECLRTGHEVGDLNTIGAAANLLGKIYNRQGDYVAATEWYERSFEALRAVGRTESISGVLHNLGESARYRGDVEEARRRYRESLDIGSEIDAKPIIQLSLHALGEMAQAEGDLEEAVSLYRQSVEHARVLGDALHEALCLASLADVAHERGNRDEAEALFREALALDPARAKLEPIAQFLDGFALDAAARGLAERALRLAGAATGIREAIRLALPPWRIDALGRGLAPAREALGTDEARRAFEAGRAMPVEEAIARVLSAEC
jgi:non-specific serine/threonine protein kinase